MKHDVASVRFCGIEQVLMPPRGGDHDIYITDPVSKGTGWWTFTECNLFLMYFFYKKVSQVEYLLDKCTNHMIYSGAGKCLSVDLAYFISYHFYILLCIKMIISLYFFTVFRL